MSRCVSTTIVFRQIHIGYQWLSVINLNQCGRRLSLTYQVKLSTCCFFSLMGMLRPMPCTLQKGAHVPERRRRLEQLKWRRNAKKNRGFTQNKMML